MHACIDVQSLSPDADYETFQGSSAALVSALANTGVCLLRLPSSDAQFVFSALFQARAGFADAFGGTCLLNAGYRALKPQKELLEFSEHGGPALQHPAGAAVQQVKLRFL